MPVHRVSLSVQLRGGHALHNVAVVLCCAVLCHDALRVRPSQFAMVDNKPVVCIDMGAGKPNMEQLEEKLLVEMQSITLERGEEVAKQAKFIIVGSDLPHRTLSAISEAPLPTQQSDNSGAMPFAAAGVAATSTTDGAVSVAGGCCVWWRAARDMVVHLLCGLWLYGVSFGRRSISCCVCGGLEPQASSSVFKGCI